MPWPARGDLVGPMWCLVATRRCPIGLLEILFQPNNTKNQGAHATPILPQPCSSPSLNHRGHGTICAGMRPHVTCRPTCDMSPPRDMSHVCHGWVAPHVFTCWGMLHVRPCDPLGSHMVHVKTHHHGQAHVPICCHVRHAATCVHM